MLVLRLELSLFGFRVFYLGMLLAFLLAQVVYFFFFLELKRSAVLSAFQLADVVRYLLQVEYFV